MGKQKTLELNEAEKRTTFDKCVYNDLKLFLSKFDPKTYGHIDMVYYYHAVRDWSEIKGSREKRTARGWLATVRTFIRGDMEKGKLHVLKQDNGEKEEKKEDLINFLKL